MNNYNTEYDLTANQLLISEYTKNVLDYYDTLVALLHSINSKRPEYDEYEKIRNNVSKKYTRIVADYNELVESGLINKIDPEKIDSNINDYVEIDRLLHQSLSNTNICIK